MNVLQVVGAVIWNERREVLCARRSTSMSMPGCWEFPDGKIEEGETPQESLIREIQEELGCTLSIGNLVADTIHAYSNRTIRLLTYHCAIVSGVPVPHEHEQLLWLPVERLGQLEWAAADLPTLEAIRCEGGKTRTSS